MVLPAVDHDGWMVGLFYCVGLDVRPVDGGVAMTARKQAAIQQAVEALTLLLDSAFPNAKEHPTMYAAWPVGHAALRTLRALGDGWEEISTERRANGNANVIGIGTYNHPFDPAMNGVEVVAQIYYNRLFCQWVDVQGNYFTPVKIQPLPLPPGGKR
jgi:hypothetical protein